MVELIADLPPMAPFEQVPNTATAPSGGRAVRYGSRSLIDRTVDLLPQPSAEPAIEVSATDESR